MYGVSSFNNTHIAELLIREGANWFAEIPTIAIQKSALVRAAEDSSSHNILRWYLEHGVEDATKPRQKQRALDSALIACASFANSSSAAQLLLKKAAGVNFSHRGADVNIGPTTGTSDKTSLQHAATNGNFEIIKMLLEVSGDINAPQEKVCGRSALEGAAGQGSLDMVRFLLEMGADVRPSVSLPSLERGKHFCRRHDSRIKRARYGVDDCVPIEEIVDGMDLLELEFGSPWKS